MPNGSAGTPLAKIVTDAKVCALAVSNYDSSVAIGTSKGGLIIVRDPGSIRRSGDKGFQHPEKTVLQRGGRCISSLIFTHHNEVVAGDVDGNLISHCFQQHASGRTAFHATVLPSAVSLPRSHKFRRHCEPIIKLDEKGGLLADCDGRNVEFWKEGRKRHGTGHWECLRILSWDDPWMQRLLDVAVGEMNVAVLIRDSILLLDPWEGKFLPTRQLEAPDCSAGLRSIALSSTGILAAAAENGIIYCWALQSSSNSNGKTTTTVTQESAVELPFGISAKRIQWARRHARASQLLAAVCDDGGLLACSLEPLERDARVCIDIRPSFTGGGSEGTVIKPPPPLVAFATGPNRLVCAQSNGPVYIYSTSEAAEAHSMMAGKDDNNWVESLVENNDETRGSGYRRTALVGGDASRVKKLNKKEEVLEEEMKFQIMLPELRSILRVRGSFTEGQRLMAWQVLLQLPRNVESFHVLVRKGVHPAFRNLGERYPIQSQVKAHKLRTLCSAIAHWSPDFGRCEFIPSIVFPFILAFRTDDLGAFETVLTVLLWFGTPWLTISPQLPLTTLAQLAACLGRFDPKLCEHLKLCGIDVIDYGWVLLRSAFSEVLRRDDWLRLWDRIFSIASVDSDAMIWVAVAIVIAKRSELLDTTDGETIRASFHSISNYILMDNILQVLQVIERKMKSATKSLVLDSVDCDHEGKGVLEAALRILLQKQHAMNSSSIFPPLPIGKYPEFDIEPPGFVEDYQIAERNSIAE
eukprot:482023_1